MKRIYTSRSLLTLLIFTVSSLFGGGNLLKAQISLTETLTFEDFSKVNGYSTAFSGSLTSTENIVTSGWSKVDCMNNGQKLQLKKTTGVFTSPTITSAAGFTVEIQYGSGSDIALKVGDESVTCASGGSYQNTTKTASLSTTSTSCSFSISAGSNAVGVSKIVITPVPSGKLSNPVFDLSAGEYVIGQQLGISAAAGANIVYVINGGEEVTVEDASASYRFPQTGSFTVKAKAVPAADVSPLTESDWTEATFIVKENVVTPVSGGELDIELWSEAFPSGFVAGSKYQLVNGSGTGTTTTYWTNEQLAEGKETGELLIRQSNGAFIVTLDDLKGVYGDIALTFKSNKGCTVSTTTSGCSVSDYTFNKPDASCIVSVPKGTTSLSLTFENTSSSNTRVDDFLLVGKVKETATAPYYPVTISASGISTFAAGQAYVMPEGLQGGIVTVNTEKNEANVTYLYEAGDVVPAREALLLKGTAGMPYSLEISEQEGTKIDDNLLRPALTYDAISAASGESFYIFANDATGGLGFYFQGADGDGSKVEGIYGKAYLAVSGTNPVRGFRLGGGDVTGIDRIENGVQAAGTSVYTLGGVRVAGSVESLPAGFYIVNGKKVLVK